MFHAGSLVTLRYVKYGVSSLTDFVSERLHCQLVLCACWHDGGETVVSTTLRATLWKLSCFDGVKRSSSQLRVAVVLESTSIFHTVDEHNQAIDSFVASSQSVAVLCSTGYLNVKTPRLFFDSSSTYSPSGPTDHDVWLIGLWNAVPGNIVDGFRVTVNKHALSWIAHQSKAPAWENCHLPDYLLNLWRCHVPDNFLALDLKNLHDTLTGLHLLHLHILYRSLHHGVRVRVQVLGKVQQRKHDLLSHEPDTASPPKES